MYAKMYRGTLERLARLFPTICIFARVHKNGRWNSSSARFLTVPKQSFYYFFAMYFLISRAIATTITIPCAMYW